MASQFEEVFECCAARANVVNIALASARSFADCNSRKAGLRSRYCNQPATIVYRSPWAVTTNLVCLCFILAR